MKKNPNPLEIPSIKKICEKTVEYFIWKNKKKKPLVRTSFFESQAQV
jgi:mRNA degradation ribonuclease J1/J2